MDTRTSRWETRFPYRGGRAAVTRLADGWRVEIEGKSAEAKTVIDAFEVLLGQPARDPELQVVLAAIVRDAATKPPIKTARLLDAHGGKRNPEIDARQEEGTPMSERAYRGPEPSEEQIRERAYEISQRGDAGSSEENWQRAR